MKREQRTDDERSVLSRADRITSRLPKFSLRFGMQLDWKDGLAAGYVLCMTLRAMSQDYLGLEGSLEQTRRSWVEFGPALAAVYTLSLAWFGYQVYARVVRSMFISALVIEDRENKQ